jgi:hypothetical protein
MARCPFAKWSPISGPVGSFVGGPFRIVHHTTEGSSAAGAIAAFRAHRSDPHFTVDQTTIYQHIDTGLSARALRNLTGGVETNRLSAIQIEVVGTAGRPKARPTLENVARLCRWLEKTHNIPSDWPSGPPKPAVNGQDPGGHNRSAQNWVSRGGHYGHCHVPENIHWDPAYTAEEAMFVMRFDPDNAGALQDPEIEALRESLPEEVPIEFEDIAIPDHADVGEEEGEDQPPRAEDRRGRLPSFGSYATPEMAVLIAGLFFAGSFLLVRSLTRR